MLTRCPVCNSRLKDEPPVAIICPNSECPVEDDCDLWYKDKHNVWRVQHWIQGPWKDDPRGGKTCSLILSKKENVL